MVTNTTMDKVALVEKLMVACKVAISARNKTQDINGVKMRYVHKFFGGRPSSTPSAHADPECKTTACICGIMYIQDNPDLKKIESETKVIDAIAVGGQDIYNRLFAQPWYDTDNRADRHLGAKIAIESLRRVISTMLSDYYFESEAAPEAIRYVASRLRNELLDLSYCE